MSYDYTNTPPPPQQQQQYGGYPQQPYGGHQSYPPQYAPLSGSPPPGQYGAPGPTPGQYGGPPPPPGQYGTPPPPSGQYGTPPPPSGQYGTPPPPPGQYGAAPPAGAYGAPPPQGQYGAPPPPGPYGAPSQQVPSWGQPSAPPPAPHALTFRFTTPGKGIVDSAVVDPWGRTGWTVSSPSKKETYIKNQGGGVVGRIEWHSSPKIEFLGYHGKSKEFLPRGKAKHTRVMRYNKQNYDLVDQNGTVHFHPRFEPGASYAILRGGGAELEIAGAAVALGNGFIEHAILVAVLYHSGHPFGDGADVLPGVWGAGAAAGVAVSC